VVLVCCRAPWYPPSNRPEGPEVLVVDDVPHRAYADYQVLAADQYLEGDVGPTLRALTRTAKALGVNDERVAARAARLSEPAQPPAAGPGLAPAAVVDCLRDLLDPNASIVDETITHSRIVQQRLRAEHPERYTYVQGGLGQGLGVALGMKMADPDREVALVIGDGSLLYNPVVQALSASQLMELPLLVVVFDNRGYASMKLNHLRFYPDGAAVEQDDFRGVDLTGQPDTAALVAPFGMFGRTVTDSEGLRPAIEEALASVRSGVTALVDVRVSH
jgi:thiamine pyrophosphate-dependent acetolactate synthase large subunit-like protein